MSMLEANKALARRFYEEFWCKGNDEAADALVAEDVIQPQLPPGWPESMIGSHRRLAIRESCSPLNKVDQDSRPDRFDRGDLGLRAAKASSKWCGSGAAASPTCMRISSC